MTVLPIVVLLLSALVTWLTRSRQNRTQWIIATVLGFVVWTLMLFVDAQASDIVGLSIWQPEDLFISPISLTMDTITWPLVYGTSTVLLAVILTATTRPTAAQARMRSFWFLYTASAVIAIMAANLLTTAMAWAVMDFGALIFLMSIAESKSDRRAIFVRTGFNAMSILLVISAAMASDIQAVVSLDLTSTSSSGIILLAIAAIFRLGLVPLHFALPPIAPLRRGVGTLLRLFPPVTAMVLLARVFEAGLPNLLRLIFFVAGSVAGLLGGVRWVLQEDLVRARPFFVLTLASLGLITATLSGNGSHVIVAVGLILLLVGAVLSLFAQHTPSHRVIPVIASLYLLGLPFTPGGVYAAAVADFETFISNPLISTLAVVIAALLALGSFHLYYAAETEWPISESLARVMFNLGLALPLLAAVGVGVWNLQADPLRGGVFALATFLLAASFFAGFRSLSYEQTARTRNLFQQLEPDRIYEKIWKGLQRTLATTRGAGELLEGVSGMLWLFVFVIVILFIIQ